MMVRPYGEDGEGLDRQESLCSSSIAWILVVVVVAGKLPVVVSSNNNKLKIN